MIKTVEWSKSSVEESAKDSNDIAARRLRRNKCVYSAFAISGTQTITHKLYNRP
jgi:hypothetical protein